MAGEAAGGEAVSWQKGPVHKLKEGIVRYEIVYRINKGEGWEVRRMWKTAPVGMEKRIGSDLYERLRRHPYPFDIVSIRDIGNEVPITDAGPVAVVSPKEYEEQRAKKNLQFDSKDVKDRARELGIWIPGEKFDA